MHLHVCATVTVACGVQILVIFIIYLFLLKKVGNARLGESD